MKIILVKMTNQTRFTIIYLKNPLNNLDWNYFTLKLDHIIPGIKTRCYI